MGLKGWRGKALLAGIVALYLGCLLAGMSLPWLTAFAFAAAVMLTYTLLMRPVREWAPNPVVLVLALLLLALVAAGLTGLGALLTRIFPAPPAWTGPGLSLLGVALSRGVWSARKSEDLDRILDGALGELGRINDQMSADSARIQRSGDEVRAEVEAVIAALPDLPVAAGRDAALDALLAPLTGDASLAMLTLSEPEDALRSEAAAALALLPEVFPASNGSPRAMMALDAALLDFDIGLARRTAERALRLDLGYPTAPGLFPSPSRLAARAETEALPVLAQLAEALAATLADLEADGREDPDHATPEQADPGAANAGGEPLDDSLAKDAPAADSGAATLADTNRNGPAPGRQP